MTFMNIQNFKLIKFYCESQHFKGWDPYDGLNSKVFQVIPLLKRSALCRLIVIQGFKRFPFNLRPLFAVPKGYNAKGIGLFLQGYCNLYKYVQKKPSSQKEMGTPENIMARIHELAELLITLQSPNYSGACWGYNFDWQCRREFLFPRNTPTVVATTFCATALMEAYEITREEKYLNTALSSADFVLKDLHRAPQPQGFIFSYSKLSGNDTVYNASLLGSKLLSYCYYYTRKQEYADIARESVLACCKAQQKDGSWFYGALPVQSWIDSFHTGYNLDGLMAYQEKTGDTTFQKNIDQGFDFYIKHFFETDGTPKYYHDRKYPIDIHCPGQLFVTLSRLHQFASYKELVDQVLNWTLRNMQDKKGYFYYQLKPGISSKIPYMRWSNAFMFHALSFYLLEQVN